MDLVTLALAKKYTSDTAEQFGAVKGAPCKIKSIMDIDGGHRITFEWKNDAGATQESTLDVIDGIGQKGDKGDQGDPGVPGAPGTDGKDGADGADGYSPTVTVTPITGGNRVTITDASGDHTFDVMNGSGGGGDAVLTAALTVSKAVGGIASGKEYAVNTPLETIFRDMLNPVENPVLTAPSATLTTTGGTLIEEAVPTSKVLTVNFNRGSINPAYGTSGYRSGEATGYTLNGGTQQTEKTFNVTVDENNKTFTARVDYAQGEQPKNSAGQNYGSPLPAGFVETSALVFEVVAALWSNAANITTVAKEALVSKSTKLKRFDFPAQTAANPEIFDVPASWTVTAVELLNTLNNQWVDCRSEFDITDTTHGTVAYKRYTYNGGDATGARSVRIKWS